MFNHANETIFSLDYEFTQTSHRMILSDAQPFFKIYPVP